MTSLTLYPYRGYDSPDRYSVHLATLGPPRSCEPGSASCTWFLRARRTTIARQRRAFVDAGQTIRTDEHARALVHAVLCQFTSRKSCPRKPNRLGIAGKVSLTLQPTNTNPIESMIATVRAINRNVGLVLRRDAPAVNPRRHAPSRDTVPESARLPRTRQPRGHDRT